MAELGARKLPNEILLLIFENLKGNDIIHAKMVCKHWLQITKNPIIASKLKLKFSSISSESELPLDFSQNISNIEIKDSSIKIFAPFFNSMGKIIQSIQLTNVEFDSDTDLYDILKVVETIHELKLVNCSFAKKNGIDFSEVFSNLKTFEFITEVPKMENILNSLPKNGIVSLTLDHVNGILVRKDRMKQLLSIIQSNNKTLTELNLDMSPAVSDFEYYFWTELNNCEYTLKSFTSSNIAKFSTSFIDFLLTQTKLTRLRLHNVKAINNDSIELIVNQLRHIQTLELRNCYFITKTGICELHNLKSLKKLTIHNSQLLDDYAILHGIAAKENLNIIKLELTYFDFTVEILENITKNLPNLEVLRLADLLQYQAKMDKSTEKYKFWKILASCVNLKELYWINNKKKYDIRWPAQRCGNSTISINEDLLINLQVLEITDFDCYIEIFKHLNLPKLLVLGILEAKNMDPDFISSDVIPIFAQKCKLIQHLHLEVQVRKHKTFDSIIESFPYLKSIRFEWNCTDCEFMTHFILQILPKREQTQPGEEEDLNKQDNDQPTVSRGGTRSRRGRRRKPLHVTKKPRLQNKYFPSGSDLTCSNCKAFSAKISNIGAFS